MTWLEWARLANVTLSLVAFGALAIRLNDTWTRLRWGLRICRGGLLLAVLSGAIGAAIRYVRHVPTDPSILLWTLATTAIITGLTLSRDDPNKHL